VRVDRATACVCREGDSNGESRMREIRTSGSTRGEWVARFSVSPSPLLYTPVDHLICGRALAAVDALP